MSKTCGECKHYNIAMFHCEKFDCYAGEKDHCEDFEPKNPPTLFDRITASPEVLAEKLVFKMIDSFYCTSGKVVRWASTIVDWEYDTRTEAIAATVAKLKETSDV